MMQRSFNHLSISILLFFMQNIYAAAIPITWQTLGPGLDYTQIKSTSTLSFGTIYAFKIDLANYQLKSVVTADNSIADLVKTNHAVIGINGGFFDTGLKSLGLRMNNKKIINPANNTHWWSIFFVRENKAYIASPKAFNASDAIQFAIQSGPRLIINGKVPPLKPGVANRTALGITTHNKVIVLATEYLPLTTTELANIMRKPEKDGGLACVNALNLDGGSSTQLYAQIENFNINVKSLSQVADVVLIVPR